LALTKSQKLIVGPILTIEIFTTTIPNAFTLWSSVPFRVSFDPEDLRIEGNLIPSTLRSQDRRAG
jgi:hypothetical protein